MYEGLRAKGEERRTKTAAKKQLNEKKLDALKKIRFQRFFT
jgi:hypothetical protein